MKVLYQLALRDPTSWRQIDSALFATLPSRPEPNPGQLGGQNNVQGWLANLSIQGVSCEGQDHVAVQDVAIGLEQAVRLTTWNDSAITWPVGTRIARVWDFLPLARDSSFGSGKSQNQLITEMHEAIRLQTDISQAERDLKRAELEAWMIDPAHWPMNTRQSQTIYAEGQRFLDLTANPPQNAIILPWAAFVLPAASITRHGVLLTDAKWAEHVVAAPQSVWSWRHWNEHLPLVETRLDADGRRILLDQRPQGRYLPNTRTLTWFQRDTNLAQGYTVATHEDSLLGSAGAGETESVTTDANIVVSWAFATPSNEPNSAAWPTGVYRTQIDCTAASAGLIYIAGLILSGNGRWNRVSSDLATRLENQIELLTAFSGTGLKLTVSGTESWTAGNSTDRFAVEVEADGDSHGDAITLRFSADAWADGPWPAAVQFPGFTRWRTQPY